MDKYAVDQDGPAKEKTSAKGKVCPDCGKSLDKDTPALKCPDCGTKPFERRPTDGGKVEEESKQEKK